MKFLEAFDETPSKELLKAIVETADDRLETIEFQEPFGGSDFFYEKWEEKYNDFQDINEQIHNLLNKYDNLNEDEIKEEMHDIKRGLFFHQLMYKGLKRLKVIL
jgi:hypothetical protein